MPAELEAIDHIHINVSDRDTSLEWYQRVLGLNPIPELAFWAAGGGPLTLANQSGSIHLALFENSDSQKTTVAFRVTASGLVQYIEHLRSLGIPVKPVDHEVSWSIYFSDPDANPYEITTYDYLDFSKKLAN